jgi:energy-coupling factor transporter ATP-binding protein EcfA2
MYRLERIVLNNWGRLDPQDIDIRGSTAILGPTGAGKSTIVDALQVIITGASSRYFDLNKSTGGQNARTIRDYCLGADDHISPDAPKFEAAESLIALAFRDRVSGEAVSIGLLFQPASTKPMWRCAAVSWRPAMRSASPIYSKPAARRRARFRWFPDSRVPGAAEAAHVPSSGSTGSGIAYVDDYLHAMRPAALRLTLIRCCHFPAVPPDTTHLCSALKPLYTTCYPTGQFRFYSLLQHSSHAHPVVLDLRMRHNVAH